MNTWIYATLLLFCVSFLVYLTVTRLILQEHRRLIKEAKSLSDGLYRKYVDNFEVEEYFLEICIKIFSALSASKKSNRCLKSLIGEINEKMDNPDFEKKVFNPINGFSIKKTAELLVESVDGERKVWYIDQKSLDWLSGKDKLTSFSVDHLLAFPNRNYRLADPETKETLDVCGALLYNAYLNDKGDFEVKIIW